MSGRQGRAGGRGGGGRGDRGGGRGDRGGGGGGRGFGNRGGGNRGEGRGGRGFEQRGRGVGGAGRGERAVGRFEGGRQGDSRGGGRQGVRHGDGGSGGGCGRSESQRGARFGPRAGGGRARGGYSGPAVKQVLTNMIPAALSEKFCFYLYSIDTVDKGNQPIESRNRRRELFRIGFWNGLRGNRTELKRLVFFAGSFFYSAREIKELAPANINSPVTLCDGSNTGGDVMQCVGVQKFTAPTCLLPSCTVPDTLATTSAESVRVNAFCCSNCSRTFASHNAMLQHCRDAGHDPICLSDADVNIPSEPASPEVFVSYVKLALDRAMAERLVRWGKEYIDRDAPIPMMHNNKNLGVSIFEAMSLSLNIVQDEENPPQLTLTCDLRAKVVRNVSVLEEMSKSCDSQTNTYSPQAQARLRKQWVGTVVISKSDHKCYTVTGLDFDHSPDTLLVPSLSIAHTEYFRGKKPSIELEHPGAMPMIEAEGRNKSRIYLPAELVTGNELDPFVRRMLPQKASFPPAARNAMEKVKRFLQPGEHTSSGGSLLPAIGVFLGEDRLVVPAKVLSAPELISAGFKVPKDKSDHWAPLAAKANFNVDPKQAVELNVVVFYSLKLQGAALKVYERIRDYVNGLNAYYRFAPEPFAMVKAGDYEHHRGAYAKYFSEQPPDNLFVLDFVKPQGATDPAYPVVKYLLAQSGFLSQFVNFKTCPHDAPSDALKSEMILRSVARQILQKAGCEIWWARIPESLPLPAMFIGVDVFHAPMVYNVTTKKRERKASCAAVVVTVLRSIASGPRKIEAFSMTFPRAGGNEYQLRDALETVVVKAKQELDVEPKSVVVWRDGIAESAEHHALEEIKGIERALTKKTVGVDTGPSKSVPLAYIVCQKRIATKLFTLGGEFGAPSGTMVTSLQGLQHKTFYINGRAPKGSTAKPVRFVCIRRDAGLNSVPLAELTWAECHNYANWAGPIKVPAVCQMAHKLAEMVGAFANDGEAPIDHVAYLNTLWFL